jgi:Zinc finger C-x8-C-x5-C-x3-H type (and similar)
MEPSSSSSSSSFSWPGTKLNLSDPSTNTGWFNILKARVVSSNATNGAKYGFLMDEHDTLPEDMKDFLVNWKTPECKRYALCKKPANVARGDSWSCVRNDANQKSMITVNATTGIFVCNACAQIMIPRELTPAEEEKKQLWSSACGVIYSLVLAGLVQKDAINYKLRPMTDAFDIIVEIKKRIELQKSTQSIARIADFWILEMKEGESVASFTTRINEAQDRLNLDTNIKIQGRSITELDCRDLLLTRAKQNPVFTQAVGIWELMAGEKTYDLLTNHLLKIELDSCNQLKPSVNSVTLSHGGHNSNSKGNSFHNSHNKLTFNSTTPCKFFDFGKGNCKFGTQCKFKHEIKRSKEHKSTSNGNSNLKRKSNLEDEICKNFLSGNCKFGDRCKRIHVNPSNIENKRVRFAESKTKHSNLKSITKTARSAVPASSDSDS